MKRMLNIAVVCTSTFIMAGCGSNNTNANKTIGSHQRNVSYLVDATKKMSLYTFDKDMPNVSNCDVNCQKNWPLFTGGNTQSTDIQVFDTNTNQLAYRKHPMYFYANDYKQGDTNGNNIHQVWHLIYAPAGTRDSQTGFSTDTMTQTYLTDSNGRTLYTFDNDGNNSSNCYGTPDTKPLGSCEARWPVFYSADLSNLPAGTTASDFGTIERNTSKELKDKNGKPLATKQTTYKGHPLYYWNGDKKAGDTKGDWIQGLWDVVELSVHKTTTPTTSSSSNRNKYGY